MRAFLINSSATSKFLRVGGRSIVNKVMAGYDDRDLLVLIFSRGQKIFLLKWRKEYMITIMQENSFSHNISVTKLQAKTKVYVSIKSLLCTMQFFPLLLAENYLQNFLTELLCCLHIEWNIVQNMYIVHFFVWTTSDIGSVISKK